MAVTRNQFRAIANLMHWHGTTLRDLLHLFKSEIAYELMQARLPDLGTNNQRISARPP